MQILCVIAFLGKDSTTATAIAKSLRTNPVVVRQLLKALERGGLVHLRPGRNGGVSLACRPEAITLDKIYRAVDRDASVFALRPGVNPRCPVSSRMKPLLGPIFDAADDAVEATLRRTTLRSLVQAIT